MPDCVLFRVQKVSVKLDEFDLPGPTRKKTVCSRCGQLVRDAREVIVDGRTLCKPCTDEAYFSDATEVTWPGMEWAPGDSNLCA